MLVSLLATGTHQALLLAQLLRHSIPNLKSLPRRLLMRLQRSVPTATLRGYQNCGPLHKQWQKTRLQSSPMLLLTSWLAAMSAQGALK